MTGLCLPMNQNLNKEFVVEYEKIKTQINDLEK